MKVVVIIGTTWLVFKNASVESDGKSITVNASKFERLVGGETSSPVLLMQGDSNIVEHTLSLSLSTAFEVITSRVYMVTYHKGSEDRITGLKDFKGGVNKQVDTFRFHGKIENTKYLDSSPEFEIV